MLPSSAFGVSPSMRALMRGPPPLPPASAGGPPPLRFLARFRRFSGGGPAFPGGSAAGRKGATASEGPPKRQQQGGGPPCSLEEAQRAFAEQFEEALLPLDEYASPSYRPAVRVDKGRRLSAAAAAASPLKGASTQGQKQFGKPHSRIGSSNSNPRRVKGCLPRGELVQQQRRGDPTASECAPVSRGSSDCARGGKGPVEGSS
ncbi:hypothetical protein cyc_03871 [Cyclospora cayetanensis]|uniref:Uncharacterized protein n=1 Tax=Cyclospora cayetanensis TaxID=88456 RepID=A0A1D3D7U5_9EIME|nr:hypothetical protein cyc_03871 [Cyclospora cayetanensis]